MEPWLDELLKVWQESIDELARELLMAFERDSGQRGKWDLDTLRQLQQGGVAMMTAEYNGHGTEMREAYLQSVLPGTFAQGISLGDSCAITLVVAMRVYPMLISRISPENRERVGDFICDCYAKYVFDVVRVGIDVMGEKT